LSTGDRARRDGRRASLAPAPASPDLSDSAAFFLQQAGALLGRTRPDLVLVQGDTTTAFTVALAGYYNRCAVGHVEAGLRTCNPLAPFPEENHRRMIAVLADLHFAPSAAAREALLAEGIASGAITLTGNTVIDALQWILQRVPDPYRDGVLPTGDARPYILVTAHRRENFERLHRQYFCELNAIAAQMPQMQVIFVMHPNPHARALAVQSLDQPNIHKVEPLPYASFLHLLRGAALIITDSGGIQEESAFFGTPTLVIRELTERRELLQDGHMIVVGTEAGKLSAEALKLLRDEHYYRQYARVNLPYGTGHASTRIVDRITQWAEARA
jgi:UDP-N-acetylglucosamine 2-epimerase (non-hydrolysing)